MVAKPKKKKQQHKLQENQYDWIHQVAFWGLAVLLFFPPYFRGLFFATEQEKALLFAALVFWVVFVWRWLQKDYKFLSTPLDYFALALPVIYMLSGFFAVNKGLAVEEIVVNILYFLTFWSVSRIVRHENDAESIIKIIYVSAVGVALAGLATATGLIYINDGFMDGRIYSTYQYPNALASLLGGVIFLGVYLWHRAGEQYREALESTKNNIYVKLQRLDLYSYLYAAGNFLLLAVLIGTKSRGGLAVFAIVALIFLIGAGVRKRLTSALHLGYTGVPAVLAANKFIPLAREEQMGQAWAWVIGGLILVLAGQFLFRFLEERLLAAWEDRNYNLSFGVIVGVIVIAAGVWLAANPALIDRLTDQDNLKTGFHRVYYMQTAGEMIVERPLLGWGGGGWSEAYQAFIDYRYPTKEVHSHYFQVGVETGFLGLLAMAGILGSFLYLAHRLYYGNKENPGKRYFIWALTAAFLMIAGHALIDFDLSLASLSMVLWSIFGIAAGLSRGDPAPENGRERKKLNFVPLAVSTVLIIVLLICTITLMHSRGLMQQGVGMIRSDQAERGMDYVERATGYGFFKPDYRVTLSQIYISMGEREKALEEARNAVNLSRYDIQPRNNLTEIAIAAGDYRAAAEAAERTIELAPNEITVYQSYANTFNKLGLEELKAGNSDQAEEYFATTLEVPGMIQDRAGDLSERDQEMWRGPRLRVTPKVMLYTGQANYWLGDFDAAEDGLAEASEKDELKGEAHMYLAMLYEKQGEQQKAQEHLDMAEEASKDITQVYESLIELPVLQD